MFSSVWLNCLQVKQSSSTFVRQRKTDGKIITHSSQRLKGFAFYFLWRCLFEARRWSKRLITFRRLTLFYRQTMNSQADSHHSVTLINRFARNDVHTVKNVFAISYALSSNCCAENRCASTNHLANFNCFFFTLIQCNLH